MNDRSGARIFVVEDESLVLMLIEDLLDELGYRLAGSASQLADGLLKAASLSFDLAILDMNLHGESSTPIADIVVGRGLPLVFVTGYRQGLPEKYRQVPVVRKPFRRSDLAQALEQCLGVPDSRI